MAAAAPDHIYSTEEYLQIITLCDEEEAKQLLAQTQNDLMLSVEIFFAMEQDSADDKSIEDDKGKVMISESGDQKNESFESGVVNEEKAEETKISSDQIAALQWPLPLSTHADVEDSQKNLISKLKRELMIEAVVVSLSSAYPVLNPGYLRNLAMQFKGKEVKVHKYLHSFKEAATEPDSVSPGSVSEEYSSSAPTGDSLHQATDT